MSEELIEEIKEVLPVQKIDRRKILRAEWRTTILEDGSVKYNKTPCDPNYYKKYYDEKQKAKYSAIICCDKCKRNIAQGHIIRHQKTNICNKIYNEILIK